MSRCRSGCKRRLNIVGEASFPLFLAGDGIEAEEDFLDVFGRIIAVLTVSERVEVAVGDDGSAGAIEIVFPELVFCAGLPGVGETGFGRGAVVERTPPIEPTSDFGGEG